MPSISTTSKPTPFEELLVAAEKALEALNIMHNAYGRSPGSPPSIATSLLKKAIARAKREGN